MTTRVTTRGIGTLPANTLLGRSTGTGEAQALTVGPGLVVNGSTIDVPGATAVGLVTGTSGQLAGNRNKIINGKMEIAQRGTSLPALAAGSYCLDRWVLASNPTAAVITVSQQADAPANNEFQNSLRLAVTTADASLIASDICSINQRIEGYNVRDLIGRTFTLSFWVRSSKTGVHCVSFGNIGGDRSYVAEYTIGTENTWEFKSITVSGGLITAGTRNWTNDIGLGVRWALASGSNFQGTAGAWQTGNFLATANQVNCLDTVGNIFAITGVQLEVGSVATPFEHRPIGAELALCQRYFWRFAGGAGNSSILGVGVAEGGGATAVVSWGFPVAMRAAPTLAYLGTHAVFDGATAPTISSTSSATITESRASVTYNLGSSVIAGRGVVYLVRASSATDHSAEL